MPGAPREPAGSAVKGATLVVALALVRLTGEPDAVPLAALVPVVVEEVQNAEATVTANELSVYWVTGPAARFRLTVSGGPGTIPA
ncbi:hypothetical protein ACF061_18705 [Streptomyces sp. NPDC015220]|uniref:hypothetical protein n=1 Tax=Streptomyces sp. NPDC015220 TaxID=3364947 RepID=UPI0036FDCB76